MDELIFEDRERMGRTRQEEDKRVKGWSVGGTRQISVQRRLRI